MVDETVKKKNRWIKNHLVSDYKVLNLDEVKKNIYYTWFSAKECKMCTLFFLYLLYKNEDR